MVSRRFPLLALFALATALWAQDTTAIGSISGAVRANSSDPVPGVQLCLTPDHCVETGPDGKFRIEGVRAGQYALTVTSAVTGAFQTAPIDVRAGLETSITVQLPRIEAPGESITVSASVYVAPEETKSSAYLIGQNEIFKTAGTLQDVSRYIQTLPGVAIGSDDFRNDIIVRGGSPLENLFIVDNIEIPNINSFANFASAGGTASILDPRLIQDVTFLTGGYPAPYINRTSGVLQVTQREGTREKLSGRVAQLYSGLGALFEGPLRKGKGSWIVSARRSFLDAFTKDIGIGGVPVTYTYNAKAVYDLSPNDRIWAINVSAQDKIRLGPVAGKVNESPELNNIDIRYSGWRSATGFNWQHLFGGRGVGLLGVTHSEAQLNQRVRDLIRDGIPPINANIDNVIATSPTLFQDNSREGESTLKYDFTGYANNSTRIQAGGSYKRFQTRYDTAAPFGNDNPYSVAPGINPFFIHRRLGANQPGVYLQTTRDLTSRLNITVGGRLDTYGYLGETRFSPRAGASLRLTNKLSWRSSFGHYFQQPFWQFLAVFPQNRDVIPWRAAHYVTGLHYAANSNLRMSAEFYRKGYRDYPVASQIPSLSLANVGDTFAVRNVLFPLASAGRGKVQGLELFIEKRFGERFFGQANFSVSKTRHAGLDGIFRPGSFDYPRIFNVIGGRRLSKNWELSARVSYLSGRPYTPFNETLSRAQNRGVFDLARVNALRLPAYFRTDVRLDRTLTFRDKPVLIFLGVNNITNRKNIAGYNWDRRLNVTNLNDGLGLFPNIGLEWRF
jgi:TonB dependent receptor/Carboxypeptidase regulatory-like domain/TonB-dependent Receptor Plug Domain